MGFRRTVERPQTLEIDPSAIGHAVGLFERYAAGAVSIDQLANEHAMNDRTLSDILKNPIYNGWVLRKGERTQAAWRESPPVDDVLWARVQSLLAARTRGDGRRRTEVPDPLRGLLRCACGSAIRRAGSWAASVDASIRPSLAPKVLRRRSGTARPGSHRSRRRSAGSASTKRRSPPSCPPSYSPIRQSWRSTGAGSSAGGSDLGGGGVQVAAGDGGGVWPAKAWATG